MAKGKRAESTNRVYAETLSAVLKEHGKGITKVSEALGRDGTWLNKKMYPKGYALFSDIEMIALTTVIGCAKEDLTAIPVSPEGRAEERRKAEAKPPEYTVDDVVTEIQALASEIAAGNIELRKDKASAQKQDELYELIRNSVKMLHADMMSILAAVKGDA